VGNFQFPIILVWDSAWFTFDLLEQSSDLINPRPDLGQKLLAQSCQLSSIHLFSKGMAAGRPVLVNLNVKMLLSFSKNKENVGRSILFEKSG